jgi:hypothetical protein
LHTPFPFLSFPHKKTRIPITALTHTKRPSTVGRWEHTLRKYGLSTAFGPKQRGGAKGRQRGRVVEDGNDNDDDRTKVAKVPLVDYDFDREVRMKMYGIERRLTWVCFVVIAEK